MNRKTRSAFFAAATAALLPTAAEANPYAGQVVVTGAPGAQTGSFYLNQVAGSVTVNFGDGSSQTIASTTAGQKTFALPSTTSSFSIVVQQTNGTGYLTSTSTASFASSYFSAPRGVTVDLNPGSNFGRVYAINQPTANTGTNSRGIFVFNSDLSKSGLNGASGTVGLTAGIPQFASSAEQVLPFRATVGPDDNVYFSDFSNAYGNLYRADANISGTSGTVLLSGYAAGSTATASTVGHGNFTSKPIVLGSGTSTTVYAIDTILGAPNSVYNATATPQYNAIRSYLVGNPAAGNTSGASAVIPTTFIGNPTTNSTSLLNTLPNTITTDLAYGPSDHRFYYTEDRSNNSGTSSTAQANLFVVDPTTGATIYDSLTDSVRLTANSNDKVIRATSVTVSPDNKYLAILETATDTTSSGAPNTVSTSGVGNELEIIPLDSTINGVSGLPDLAKMIVIPNAFGSNTGNGRDIYFDAADNIYATSSGAAKLIVASPGGTSTAITSYNGATGTYSYSFASTVPEPTSVGLVAVVTGAAFSRKRRARTPHKES